MSTPKRAPIDKLAPAQIYLHKNDRLRQHCGVTKPQRVWGLRAVLALGFWTLLGLAFGVQFHFASEQIGNPVPWPRALLHSLSDWYIFALLSIPAVLLIRRLPIERPQVAVALLIHLCASVAFSIVYVFLRSALAVWQTPDQISFAEAFRTLLVKSWHFNVVVYWVIGAVTQAFDYNEKFRDRELRASELERRLTEARLQALQMQLNPHFLFNTLHAISVLMHKNVDAADAMLVRLSELLRHALEATNIQEVTLREELDFLSRYLEIERARFGDRLNVRMEIAPETLDLLVPNLVLQPVLENAIRHGIEPHARDGIIELRTQRTGEFLCITVRDNGGGLTEGGIEEGVGLSNTRARLEQLYPRQHRFELANRPGGGVQALIELPCRRDHRSAAALTSPQHPDTNSRSPSHENARSHS